MYVVDNLIMDHFLASKSVLRMKRIQVLFAVRRLILGGIKQVATSSRLYDL